MLRRLLAQLGMQAWAAISATMSVKLLSNLFYELGIFSFADALVGRFRQA